MNRRVWLDLGGATLAVAAAAGLRALLFAGLGRGTPYATFYPAVMAAAVLGGLPAGLLATALSALVCGQGPQAGPRLRGGRAALGHRRREQAPAGADQPGRLEKPFESAALRSIVAELLLAAPDRA